MNRFISGASAALLLGFTAIAGVTPAAAATTRNFQQQDQYIGTYCGANQNAKGCNDWQTQHSQWSQSQYQGFYRSHQNDNGFGNTAAAGLFGLAVGAAAVGVMRMATPAATSRTASAPIILTTCAPTPTSAMTDSVTPARCSPH